MWLHNLNKERFHDLKVSFSSFSSFSFLLFLLLPAYFSFSFFFFFFLLFLLLLIVMSLSKELVFWTAATEGNLDLVKQLAQDSSLDINWGDGDHQRTPFYRACGHGRLEIVKYLLKDPRIDVNKKNTNKGSPFNIACQQNDLDIMEVLLGDPRVEVNIQKEDTGVTCLLLACERERIPVAKMLLEHPRIDVNLPDHDGMTAFSLACENGSVELVSIMLRNPRIEVNLADKENVTPFFVACQNGHKKVVELLLADHRIDVNVPNIHGSTSLWIASQNGHLPVVQIMLVSGRIFDLQKKTVAGQGGWNSKSAAEIARLQSTRTEMDADESEVEFLLAKKHGVPIANLLDFFEQDPHSVRAMLRRLPGIRDPYIGEVFALVVFLSDGLVRLKCDSEENADMRRFFLITQSVHMDLQMLLCNRLFDSPQDIVLTKHSEPAFRKFAKQSIWIE
jgi:ankyrin repeat protein